MRFSLNSMRPLKLASLWLPVIGWAGLIFYFSDVPNLTTNLGVWDLILRKIAHVFEYAVLGILLVNAWMKTWTVPDLWGIMKWCIFVGLLYAVSDEVHQAFVPGRGPSAWDVMIDGIGVLLGVKTTPFLLKWKGVGDSK